MINELPLLAVDKNTEHIVQREYWHFKCDDCDKLPTEDAIFYVWRDWECGYYICEECHKLRIEDPSIAEERDDATYENYKIIFKKENLIYLGINGEEDK